MDEPSVMTEWFWESEYHFHVSKWNGSVVIFFTAVMAGMGCQWWWIYTLTMTALLGLEVWVNYRRFRADQKMAGIVIRLRAALHLGNYVETLDTATLEGKQHCIDIYHAIQLICKPDTE